MHQVKLFSGEEDYRDQLEADVNTWLRTTNPKVVSITGNIAPQTVIDRTKTTPLPGASQGQTRTFVSSDILVVIVYET